MSRLAKLSWAEQWESGSNCSFRRFLGVVGDLAFEDLLAHLLRFGLEAKVSLGSLSRCIIEVYVPDATTFKADIVSEMQHDSDEHWLTVPRISCAIESNALGKPPCTGDRAYLCIA